MNIYLNIWLPHHSFSSHMLVHVILLMVVGPLVMATFFRRINFSLVRKFPFIGWIAGIAVMWLWHIPALFHLMLNGKMVLEAISLVAAGVLFSVPVIHPNSRYRLDPLKAVLYLFSACIACSLLGLLITFAPAGMYSTEADQQVAGLIMWVPCCFVYVATSMYLLLQWFKEKEKNTELTKR